MLGADPTATVSLDRSAWERAGAIFTNTDDGNGEMPGLATATVYVAGVPVQFGVLDYDSEDTYLLVPGTDPERLVTTTALLEALESADVLRVEEDLLDIATPTPPPTLEDRVADLERRLAETQLELTAVDNDMTITIAGIDFDYRDYDDRGDTLYLHVGVPKDPPAKTLETPEGHIVEYDEHGAIVGLELMGVRGMLDRNEELQLTWPPAHLAVSALRQALAA
jgi:uncharacterized protein YuzE